MPTPEGVTGAARACTQGWLSTCSQPLLTPAAGMGGVPSPPEPRAHLGTQAPSSCCACPATAPCQPFGRWRTCRWWCARPGGAGSRWGGVGWASGQAAVAIWEARPRCAGAVQCMCMEVCRRTFCQAGDCQPHSAVLAGRPPQPCTSTHTALHCATPAGAGRAEAAARLQPGCLHLRRPAAGGVAPGRLQPAARLALHGVQRRAAAAGRDPPAQLHTGSRRCFHSRSGGPLFLWSFGRGGVHSFLQRCKMLCGMWRTGGCTGAVLPASMGDACHGST